MSGITISQFQLYNRIRNNAGDRSVGWSTADWACALAGEVGEVCDEVKKLRRLTTPGKESEREIRSKEEVIKAIGDELGDVLAYAVLLADHLKIDLEKATIDKFNEVSQRINSDIVINRSVPENIKRVCEQCAPTTREEWAQFVGRGVKHPYLGKGTLRVVYDDEYGRYVLGVEFDKSIDGHNLNVHAGPILAGGPIQSKKGHWCAVKEITLLPEAPPAFRIGDRVRYTREYIPGAPKPGATGTVTVKGLDKDDWPLVDFDQHFPNGWDCEGVCSRGHGYVCEPDEIELLTPDEKEVPA